MSGDYSRAEQRAFEAAHIDYQAAGIRLEAAEMDRERARLALDRERALATHSPETGTAAVPPRFDGEDYLRAMPGGHAMPAGPGKPTDPGLTCGALSNDGSACTRLPHSESPSYHTDGTEYCWIGAPGTPAARATLGRLAWPAKPTSAGRPGCKGESMRPAREVARELVAALETFGQSLGQQAENVDRLTAAIEARDRETVEAALAAFGPCNHVDCPDVECDRVRSLSPKGTTP